MGAGRDVLVVAAYRMLLNLAGLLLPLSSPMNPSIWVSLNYGTLAAGGLVGYLFGFRRPQKITLAMTPVLFAWYPYTMPIAMFELGILDPLATPMIYEKHGDKAVSLVSSLTSFGIAASGLLLLLPPFLPFLLLPSVLLLPSITRKTNVKQAVASSLNVETALFAASTFVLGGLYTIFLARMSGVPYAKYMLAAAAVSMGIVRLASHRLQKWLYAFIMAAGLGFMAFAFNYMLFLSFILPYAVIYPMITMMAGKRGGKDPTTAINAAFAGVGTGSAVLPAASRSVNVLAFPSVLIVIGALMAIVNKLQSTPFYRVNKKFANWL